MTAWLASLGPWSWILLGLLLMGLELTAPGVFFLWLGLAAVATGLLDGALGLSWQAAFLVFAVLSVGSVLVGRLVTRRRDEEDRGPASLNRRGHALVGQVFTLDNPIAEGSGRIRVDDSSWRIIGPDAPAGASVRVVRVDGATLVVERRLGRERFAVKRSRSFSHGSAACSVRRGCNFSGSCLRRFSPPVRGRLLLQVRKVARTPSTSWAARLRSMSSCVCL